MTNTPTSPSEAQNGHWTERLAQLRAKTVDFILEHPMGSALTVWAGTYAAQVELVQSGAQWASPFMSPASAAVHLALPVAAFAGVTFFKERRERQEQETRELETENALADRYARQGLDGVDKMALPLRDWNLNDDNPQFLEAVHEAVTATQADPDAAERFKELLRTNDKMREAVVQFMQKYNAGMMAPETQDVAARNRAAESLDTPPQEDKGTRPGS